MPPTNARPGDRKGLPWRRLDRFLGDERNGPADQPDSNDRGAHEAMIARVPIPPAQGRTMPTGPSPAEAAAAYERTRRSFYGGDTLDRAGPLFDLTLLGLGADGHTASLFPETLALEERRPWVVPVVGVKAEPRAKVAAARKLRWCQSTRNDG